MRQPFEAQGCTGVMGGEHRDPDQDKMGRLSDTILSTDPASVEYAIFMLDDEDIRIRGEAFCALVLNRGEIAYMLERHLGSPSHNIRAFCALALANRGDTASAPYIVPLLEDTRAAVRSCALGALGYLGHKAAADQVASLLNDENEEVRRSAAHAVSCLKVAA